VEKDLRCIKKGKIDNVEQEKNWGNEKEKEDRFTEKE
jgi:hypothetical protein